MRLPRLCLLVLALSAILIPAHGQVTDTKSSDRASHKLQLPDFDIRDSLSQDTQSPAGLAGHQLIDLRLGNLDALRSAPGGNSLWVVPGRYGLPKMLLRHGGVLTGPSNSDPEQIARDFLRSYQSVFPFRPDELDRMRVLIKDVTPQATFLAFNQTVGGINVFNGQIKFTLSHAGEVIQAAAADVVPDLNLTTTPRLSAEQAALRAIRFSGMTVPPALTPTADPNGRILFVNPGGSPQRPIFSELTVLPMGADSARLAWRIFVYVDTGSTYEILVDAADGTLLFRHRLNRSVAQARVWQQSPVAASRQLVSFPAGWLSASASVTTGNNTDVFVDANGDDVPDTTVNLNLQNGRAYSPAQIFDFTAGEGTTGQDPRNYKPAAVTNLFYLINLAHDFYYGLGFTETAGNFQTDNFGRGGAGNDAVIGEAQQGNETNNASFEPAPDGTSPHLRVGLFTRGTSSLTDDFDGDYDGQLVLHEYGHGVSNRLVGAGTSTSCLDNIQSGGMGEGWSDYFAISYFNNPVFGAYPAHNPAIGIRRQSYEGYTYTYQDVGNGLSGYEVHDDGEIWAATLWDLRKSLGQAVTDQLVINGLKSTPCNPSMIDARDAIFTADQATYGGSHRAAMWQVFARHGMGYSAAGTDLTLNGTIYNAAYDQPPDLQAALNPRITSQPIVALALGNQYSYQIAATNPAGGSLAYALNAGPSGMAVNPASGLTQWTAGFTGKRVKITVTDGKGGRVVHGFLLPVDTPIAAGVPITIGGSQNDIGWAHINVPAGSPLLEVTLRYGTGDADLVLIDPNGYIAGISQANGNNETIAAPLAISGQWRIAVLGYKDFSGVSLKANLINPPSLTLGAPSIFNGQQNDSFYADINVPSGATALQVTLRGGSGDADLFLYQQDGSLYEISGRAGNNETLTIPAPPAGHWTAQVLGFANFSSVALTASLIAPQLLPGNNSLAGLSGVVSSETLYRVRVPFGATSFSVSTSGGTGDVDLFVRFGSPAVCPESTLVAAPCLFDQYSAHDGNAETVTFNAPAAGDYYIDVLGYATYSGVTLTTTVVGGSTAATLSVSPSALTYTAQEGGSPSSQNLSISASTSGYNWAAQATSSGSNWLTLSKTSGTGDATITATVNPAGLARGTYTGLVAVSAAGLNGSPQNIPVTLTVTPGSSGGNNLAQGKAATQSSTLPGYPGAAASSAVDGNTNGNFFANSVTTTNFENTPWWQVDLGASASISSVVVWNRTDCCGSRLGDYWVFISDTPFLATDTPANLQSRAGTFSRHFTSPPSPSTNIPANAQGRYVRIQLSGADYLSLAEVQVFGSSGPSPSNLAQGKSATQSSTLAGFSGTAASSAVDGNTDGSFFNNSVTATNFENTPWWQVDLGASASISSVVVWNRTDCCGSRLGDYWVFISDTPFLPTDTPGSLQSRAGTFSRHFTSPPSPSTNITVNAQGRYLRVQLSGADYLSLAEVQVFGSTGPSSSNLAQGKPAAQSSTLPGFSGTAASSAVDGNTDGSFFNNSVTATNFENTPWWQVDLGASTAIGSIVIWNRTDCCGSRLGDYWVFVSDTPFLATDTPASLQSRAGTWARRFTSPPSPSTNIAAGAQGRYLRVQLSGADYLSLAEVQVFAGAPASNLSQGKAASQSSTLPGYAGSGAASAVDGSTDGNFLNNSVTATNLENSPWWQVDLGASASVSSITIWNRTDCCGSRLGDYWVFVSDTPFLATDTPATLQFRAGTWNSHQTTAPGPSTTINAGTQGRYVRVQLTGANYLSLAEVQVFGTGGGAPSSNRAQGKAAVQSSTLPGYPGTGAIFAVDGNTDGNFLNNSVTATNFENSPWWQVDLGSSTAVSSVVIWNRTDCCGSRLNDYWVFVSDTPFLATDTPATLQFRAGTWNSHQTAAPGPSTSIPAATQGRYVRVQLTGANYLSLAEVQVFGQ